MGLTDLIPAPYRWIAYGIGALVVVASLGYAVHRHNESIREPLRREVKFLTGSIEAQKKQAARLLAEETAKVKAAEAERDTKIAELTRGFNADKAKRDADFDKLRREHGRLLDRDSAGCGASGSGPEGRKTEDAGRTPQASGGNPLSESLERLLWDLIRDTDETIAQYQFCQKYAESISAK